MRKTLMPSHNVVPLRSRPLVQLVDSPVAIHLLQQELLASKATYTAIAQKAQVASSTVSNIASGQTRWPRLETIIRILSALNWQIIAQRNED
jgi:DNA-binding phage protein